MGLLEWLFRRPPLGGIRSCEAAARWAETRFPTELRPAAAYVADVLCEQVGLKLTEIEPDKEFITDLQVDEETFEFVTALEEDFDISISDADAVRLNTVLDMVVYLHARVPSGQPAAGRYE